MSGDLLTCFRPPLRAAERGHGMALQRSHSEPTLRRIVCRDPAETRFLSFLRKRPCRAQSAVPVSRKAELPFRPQSAPKKAKGGAIRERLLKRIATGCHVAFLGAKIKDLPGLDPAVTRSVWHL